MLLGRTSDISGISCKAQLGGISLLAGSARTAHCCLLTHRIWLFLSARGGWQGHSSESSRLVCGMDPRSKGTCGTLPGKNLGCCRCISKQRSGQSWQGQQIALYCLVQGAAQEHPTCPLKLRWSSPTDCCKVSRANQACSMPPTQPRLKVSKEFSVSSTARSLDHASPLPPGLSNLEDQSHGLPLFLPLLHCVTCRYSGKNFCFCTPSPGPLSRHFHGQTTPLCSGELLSASPAKTLGWWERPC